MTFVSGGLLAAEVTRAGGFGFLAIEFRFGIERFQADFALARERLGTPEGEVLPIGVGVIGWMLDAPIGVKEMLKWAIMQGVKAVWLSFGEDIGKWVQFVREADEERGDGRKTLVAVQLGTVQQMKVAAEEWKVDIIVAQGSEAGGHSWAAASSTATLLTQVQAALPAPRPIILAAGGVSSGAHIASYLALGASGVVVGTLFAGTEESVYDPFSKDVILKAGYDDAVRTTLWDRVQTYPWPKGIDGRAICQQLRDDDAAGLGIDQIREKIKEDAKEGNRSREIVWAGYPAAYIKQIRPAKDVVEQLHRETVECLRLGTTLVKTD
ncbi:inosine monophosphate dehydrogenase [Dacryopinax primogenitus]|uniref:Inosine monophosphate dehydrogenase n=1 Tax=Dacryopinax primogenitus (strain DJM 731) TaxID=1858805 RepID=M5G5E0_DACPD|nr:inosine monophosphate dehydrogenase [Dacryopinax primogenitus]EJU03899.1 inosine monophosphate dehydrogenase [Dacryopinax primogenitus]